jgi:hypothetical protein
MASWPAKMSVFGLWPMAMKTPMHIDLLRGAGLHVLDAQAGDAGIVAEHFVQRAVVENGDLACLFFLEQLVLHDLLGAELVAAVNQCDVAGDVGQVERFLDAVLPPPTTATGLLR